VVTPMSHDSSQPHQMDPRLKRALAHRLRLEILGYLMKRRGGTGTGERELGDAFGMNIRLVEYHLKVLHDADLIAHVDDGQEQGTPERSYVAAAAGR
jgi:DNA-binding transcriptional ArsR family regulator